MSPIRCCLTQDPIGLAGGVNLYAYAGNDPIQFSDPFGLRGCTQEDYSDCKVVTLSVGKGVVGEKVEGRLGPLHASVGASAGAVQDISLTASLHVESDTHVEATAEARVAGVGPEAKEDCNVSTQQCSGSASMSATAEGQNGNAATGGASSRGDISLSVTMGTTSVGVTVHLGQFGTAAVGAARQFVHGLKNFFRGSEKQRVEQPNMNPFNVQF